MLLGQLSLHCREPRGFDGAKVVRFATIGTQIVQPAVADNSLLELPLSFRRNVKYTLRKPWFECSQDFPIADPHSDRWFAESAIELPVQRPGSGQWLSF